MRQILVEIEAVHVNQIHRVLLERLFDGDSMLLLAPLSNFVGERAIPFGGGQQSSGGFGTFARENQRTVTCLTNGRVA